LLDVLERAYVDKAEAIAVLKELFAVCPEIGQAVFVSLDPDNVNANSKGFYKIRLQLNLDSHLRDCITKILNAHKLEMTETKDLAIIYGTKG